MIDSLVPAKLVGVRATAFVMVMGGLLVASSTIPILRASPQASRHPDVAFLFTYLALWGVFLGIGLERRSSWAWEGSVYMASLWAVGFLWLALGVLSLRHEKTAVKVVMLTVCVILAVPALALIRYLVSADVRKVFDAEFVSGHSVPDAWIRLIAIGALNNSGMGLTEFFSTRLEPLFGVIDNRIAIFTYQVVALLLAIYSGIGLYRLNELARRVAIALFALYEVQYLTWQFLAPVSTGRFTPLGIGLGVYCSVLVTLQTWYLHTRRQLFSQEPVREQHCA